MKKLKKTINPKTNIFFLNKKGGSACYIAISKVQDSKLCVRPAVPPKQETGTAWLPCPSVILKA